MIKMYKYRYTETKEGIMTFYLDGKEYTVASNHKTLPNEIELPKKVNIVGLELEEDTKRKKTKEQGVD